MTRKERVLLPWECTLGGKSHINIYGKIVFFPIIVVMATTFSLLELFFSCDDVDV